MKMEDLIKVGLTEEQAREVQALHKADLDGNYVPKVTFDAERQKVKDRDATIADRDKQILDLGAFKGDNEALQKRVEELTSKNEATKKEYDEKIARMEMDSAIRFAVADKVHNVDDILSKLDVSKLFIKDGHVVSGLSEQLDDIKQKSPHYFKLENPNPNEAGNNLPPGWAPFGKTPAEGNGGQSENSAEDFGRALAKQQVQNNAVAQRASETYFK